MSSIPPHQPDRPSARRGKTDPDRGNRRSFELDCLPLVELADCTAPFVILSMGPGMCGVAAAMQTGKVFEIQTYGSRNRIYAVDATTEAVTACATWVDRLDSAERLQDDCTEFNMMASHFTSADRMEPFDRCSDPMLVNPHLALDRCWWNVFDRVLKTAVWTPLEAIHVPTHCHTIEVGTAAGLVAFSGASIDRGWFDPTRFEIREDVWQVGLVRCSSMSARTYPQPV